MPVLVLHMLAAAAAAVHQLLPPHFQQQPCNVRSFGAVGDGQHNDTGAFARAIHAAWEGAGSCSPTVIVPTGTYVICNVVLKPGVSLLGGSEGGGGPAPTLRTPPNASMCVTQERRGQGPSGILLEMKSNTAVEGLRFFTINSTAVHAGDLGMAQKGGKPKMTAVANVTVRRCEFDGGGDTRQVAIHLERLPGPWLVADSWIHSFGAAGAMFDEASNGVVTNNTVHSCKHHGLVFTGETMTSQFSWPNFTNYAIANLTFTRNTVVGASGGAIWGSCGTNITMMHNQISGKGDVGLDLENCRRSMIAHNSVTGHFNAGVALFLSCIGVDVVGNNVSLTEPAQAQDCNADAPDCAGCSPCDAIWVTQFNPVREGSHGPDRITWIHKDINISRNTVAVAPRMAYPGTGLYDTGFSRGAGIGVDSGESVLLSGNHRVGGATVQTKAKFLVID